MFEKYSYKQKCIALAVIFVMLSVTAYKRSFSALFEVIGEYRELSAKSEDIRKKSKNLKSLEREIAWLDNEIGKGGVTKQVVQQGIVGFAAEKHSGVSINGLEPIHAFSDGNYNIITNQLDVTGKVNELLRLGYDFEKSFTLSRPVSMNFYKEKKNNQSDVLHLKIIFQNYENNP
jgi:hypothetical protein